MRRTFLADRHRAAFVAFDGSARVTGIGARIGARIGAVQGVRNVRVGERRVWPSGIGSSIGSRVGPGVFGSRVRNRAA